MARARKATIAAEQLQLAVDGIGQEPRPATVAALRPVAAPLPVAEPPPVAEPKALPPAPVAEEDPPEVADPPEPFGRWLLAQAPLKRAGLIGMLAAAAKGDPRFPRAGDADAVRRHVGALGADGDIHEAIDDAEREWMRL